MTARVEQRECVLSGRHLLTAGRVSEGYCDECLPPVGGEPAAPALPEVGTVRSWTDRIGTRHQGRVTAVDAAASTVSFATAHGATATVPAAHVVPPEQEQPDADQAQARLAAVAHARRWLDTTLPGRLEDAVTGAWDALHALEPDGDSDQQKVDAGKVVVDAARALLERLEAHVAAKQEAKETP